MGDLHRTRELSPDAVLFWSGLITCGDFENTNVYWSLPNEVGSLRLMHIPWLCRHSAVRILQVAATSLREELSAAELKLSLAETNLGALSQEKAEAELRRFGIMPVTPYRASYVRTHRAAHG